MENIEYDHIGKVALLGLIFCALVGLAILVFSPKNVDYYYLSRGSDKPETAACVYAHWTWHYDEISFCSDDYQRAIDFAAKANATIVKK